ncbi:hypothetical protein ACFV1X_21375 [Streptomyces coelicoflavus]|uniref:hypothetical protein n=1 Tax=Streptomyces coelicoflavus TaxID=285562 RepID=UPI0036B61A7D
MNASHPAQTPHDPHQRCLQQFATYLRESALILAGWDAYSDEHTGDDGWPHDTQAYGLRAAVRDADTWRAFNRVRYGATDLLDTAEAQLRQLDDKVVQQHRAWRVQLRALRVAVNRLNALQSEWLNARATLPDTVRPGTKAYADITDDRNAEAWHYLNEWSVHGHVLVDINTAALEQARTLHTGTVGSNTSAAPHNPAATRRGRS